MFDIVLKTVPRFISPKSDIFSVTLGFAKVQPSKFCHVPRQRGLDVGAPPAPGPAALLRRGKAPVRSAPRISGCQKAPEVSLIFVRGFYWHLCHNCPGPTILHQITHCIVFENHEQKEYAFVHCSCNKFIQSIQTKVKQYQAKWPPEDLTLVENPSTRALCFCFIRIRTLM